MSQVRPTDRVRAFFKQIPGARALVRELRHVVSPPSYAEYSVALYAGPSLDRLEPHPRARLPLLGPPDIDDHDATLVADPFVFRRDGRWYLFFEVLPRWSDRGVIAVATSPDGIRWEYGETVLSEPFHLSYPQVFEHEGAVYMLPEAHQSGGVRLYRAERFPERWVLDRILVEGGPYVDSTVFRTEDGWWMLTDGSPGLTCDHLHLFHARDLPGPWAPHPDNPLRAGDKRLSRPAGPVVEVEGRLHRFAQDCEPLYGLRVSALEIRELSPEQYREVAAFDGPILEGTGVAGEWNAGGMHHVHPVLLDDGTWLAFVDGWRRTAPGRLRWLTHRLRKGVASPWPR